MVANGAQEGLSPRFTLVVYLHNSFLAIGYQMKAQRPGKVTETKGKSN